MARIVKSRQDRRIEIIRTSERLFRERGFDTVSVDMIITEMGVAKGTFYYHFKSKDEVLKAIVEHTLDDVITAASEVADMSDLDALEKMKLLLGGSALSNDDTLDVADMLHLPQNRALHELTNVETVMRLSPVLTRIVEQGIRERHFTCERPLETIQFLLTGSQFLLDGGLYKFTPAERKARRMVVQTIVEQALGAPPESFSFMNDQDTN